jgi:hypothetical protein
MIWLLSSDHILNPAMVAALIRDIPSIETLISSSERPLRVDQGWVKLRNGSST